MGSQGLLERGLQRLEEAGSLVQAGRERDVGYDVRGRLALPGRPRIRRVHGWNARNLTRPPISLRLRAKQQLEGAELSETGFEDCSECGEASRVAVHLEAMPFGDESLQDGVEEPTWLAELLGNRRSDVLRHGSSVLLRTPADGPSNAPRTGIGNLPPRGGASKGAAAIEGASA